MLCEEVTPELLLAAPAEADDAAVTDMAPVLAALEALVGVLCPDLLVGEARVAVLDVLGALDALAGVI